MQYSVVAVLAAVAGVKAGIVASSNVTYTTEVVTALTTYCPEATVLTHAGTTYTITEVRCCETCAHPELRWISGPDERV